MASVPQQQVPVPFFTDTRPIVEKLNCDKQPWMPHKGDGPPMIFGLVLERGTFTSNYKNEIKQTARVLTAENIEWSVVAFPGYLNSEFERKSPRVGDFVAIAYKGVKPSKKEGENDAYDFQMEVERGPDPAYAETLVSSQTFGEQAAGDAYLESIAPDETDDEAGGWT